MTEPSDSPVVVHVPCDAIDTCLRRHGFSRADVTAKSPEVIVAHEGTLWLRFERLPPTIDGGRPLMDTWGLAGSPVGREPVQVGSIVIPFVYEVGADNA